MAAAYDDYDYPKYWDSRKYEHASEVFVLQDFFRIIGKNKKILEIGGGYGRLAKEYEKYAKKIVLAEPSKSLISKARIYLAGGEKKMQYVESTLQNLPKKLGSAKYDVVVLVRVMHHIKDPKEAVEMASKYLPKGGYFILEFANKLHGKAILKNLMTGNITFPLDIFPIDKRSNKNIKNDSILFLNHHPDVITGELKNNGFKIIQKRSVSNIRSVRLKKIIPHGVFMDIEKKLQKPLAKLNFGPSIFILAKKTT